MADDLKGRALLRARACAFALVVGGAGIVAVGALALASPAGAATTPSAATTCGSAPTPTSSPPTSQEEDAVINFPCLPPGYCLGPPVACNPQPTTTEAPTTAVPPTTVVVPVVQHETDPTPTTTGAAVGAAELATTGRDTSRLVWAGFALIGVGALAVGITRRSSHT